MIKVGVSHQHEINGRKIVDPQPGLSNSLQKKQPAGEIGINGDVQAAHLHEKRCMSDEGDA